MKLGEAAVVDVSGEAAPLVAVVVREAGVLDAVVARVVEPTGRVADAAGLAGAFGEEDVVEVGDRLGIVATDLLMTERDDNCGAERRRRRRG